MTDRRQPGDRAMRIYPSSWLLQTIGLDEKATGFYVTLLARSEAEPIVPAAVVNECGMSRYIRKRCIRDLSGDFVGLVEPVGRDLRLVEWDAPSTRWRWFGRPSSAEPIAGVSRIQVPGRRQSLPRALREFVVDRDGRFCGICGSFIQADEPLDIDHVIPVALGGSNEPSNLQAAHAVCNRRKGARVLGEVG